MPLLFVPLLRREIDQRVDAAAVDVDRKVQVRALTGFAQRGRTDSADNIARFDPVADAHSRKLRKICVYRAGAIPVVHGDDSAVEVVIHDALDRAGVRRGDCAADRRQMYTPGIDPEIIARVKDAVRVPVLGNGDIHSAEDAVRMMQATGCDGVMIARGALGDPWLFERVNAAIEGLPPRSRTCRPA